MFESTAPSRDESSLIEEAMNFLVSQTGWSSADFCLVLGSGWGTSDFLKTSPSWAIPANAVPGFAHSGIPGHLGTIRGVNLENGKKILVIGARTHLYEGLGIDSVVRGIRLASALGASISILTNGSGSLVDSWEIGIPVLISDHINLTGCTPLTGPKFVDLTDLYSSRLRELVRSLLPSIKEGVYVQFRGPQYETPAEVRMAQNLGGHLVGMSTALEAIAAREAGMEVLGLSLLTNLAAGLSPNSLSHEEVVSAGRAAGPMLGKLLENIIRNL